MDASLLVQDVVPLTPMALPIVPVGDMVRKSVSRAAPTGQPSDFKNRQSRHENTQLAHAEMRAWQRDRYPDGAKEKKQDMTPREAAEYAAEALEQLPYPLNRICRLRLPKGDLRIKPGEANVFWFFLQCAKGAWQRTTPFAPHPARTRAAHAQHPPRGAKARHAPLRTLVEAKRPLPPRPPGRVSGLFRRAGCRVGATTCQITTRRISPAPVRRNACPGALRPRLCETYLRAHA